MRRLAFWLAALLAALAAGGCSTLGYYAQAVGGHLNIVHRARPVSAWLADPATPPALRARLELAERIRNFAVSELKEPDNASYRSYADLQRSAAVWNVVAAPELSLTLKTWCFPVMGCVGYRGYYRQDTAEAQAATLKAEGWETSVYGVPAYSTLGWTNWLGGDPLLNTFIAWPEGELARLIFHELAHQEAYADDDTTFNESFAVAVSRIGSRRWLREHGSVQARTEDAAVSLRQHDFRALTARTRAQLQAVYDSRLPDADKRARKAEIMAAMRTDYAALKAGRWGGFAGYDAWFAHANNASLGVQAAYNQLVPEFERLFEHEGQDFSRFYAEVRRLAALPKAERRATLAAIR